MKIFLSYASQDRAVADTINRALLEQGHDVFFDRDDLPPGEEFNTSIRRSIERADLFVFLISDNAIDPGSYTLNELEIAERRLRQPSGRMLPVMLTAVSLDRLPAFVKSVTLLQTPGNIAAAVAEAVDRIAAKRRRALLTKIGGAVALVGLIAAGVAYSRSSTAGTKGLDPTTQTAGQVGAPSGAPAGVRADSQGGAPTTGANEIVGKDGAPSLLVAAGTFIMGDDEESPRRELYLDAFYIDRYEVTTARYAKFLEATGSVGAPEGWEELKAERGKDLPVVGVDWNDAVAYCKWVGRRLPTDAEWEKAARGSDERRYPWGNESPTVARANYENSSPEAYDGGLMNVGAHPSGRSPFGIDDMAGNANEWVADWFTDSFRSGDVRNPKGPESGNGRVIRGGGRFEPAERILSTKRYHGEPQLRNEDLGFRCARDA